MHGQEMCFSDATYKTTKFNMTWKHSLYVLTLMLVTPLLAASLLQMKQRSQ